MNTGRAYPTKRAYRVNEVPSAYGIKRTQIYELIKEGKLASVKVGGSRLILAESLEALLQGEAE